MGKIRKVEYVARFLHQMFAYTTLTLMYTIPKLNNPELSDEEREKALEIISHLETNAETLFDDLPDDIKSNYKKMAKDLLRESGL